MSIFHGGLSLAEFSQDFDATDPTIISLDKHQLITEGQNLGEPETLSAELGSGQEGPTGEDLPFELRAKNMDAADADTLRESGIDTIPYQARLTSLDGVTEARMDDVILHVATSPISERGSYGFVRISWTATSAGKDKPYTITQTTS